ncbi:MAG: hypothetical protein DRI57_32420 [Deltaproteobacteria bacterium]|nr:MAG: hypothetical protein DRI57_32420 [Deltaproteobacteria bacterium]
MSLESKATKKCPYCHVILKAADTKCFGCKNKVGPADKYGIAEKLTDWMSYIIAVISCGGFAYFAFWLFFLKDKG